MGALYLEGDVLKVIKTTKKTVVCESPWKLKNGCSIEFRFSYKQNEKSLVNLV